MDGVTTPSGTKGSSLPKSGAGHGEETGWRKTASAAVYDIWRARSLSGSRLGFTALAATSIARLIRLPIISGTAASRRPDSAAPRSGTLATSAAVWGQSRSSHPCCCQSAARTTSPFCSAYPVSRRGRSIMYRSTNRHGQWRSGHAATASSVQAATARWPGASMGRPGGRATPTTTLDENSRPSRREGARCLLKRLGEKPRRLVDQPLARAAHVHQCRGISLPRQYSGSLRLVFIVASGQITPG